MVKLINNQNLGSRDEHFLFNPKTMPLVKDFLGNLYVSKKQAIYKADRMEETRTNPWVENFTREEYIEMCTSKDEDAIEEAIDLYHASEEEEDESYEFVKEILLKHFLDGNLVFKDG